MKNTRRRCNERGDREKVGIDQEGFDSRVGFEFETPVTTVPVTTVEERLVTVK